MAEKKRNGYTKVEAQKRAGQPHKLNWRICQNFINGFSSGNYVRAVCQWVGVNHSTYTLWVNRGEAEMERVNVLGHDAEQIVLDAIMVELPLKDWNTKEGQAQLNETKALPDLFDWAPDPFDPQEWKFALFRVMTQRARALAEVRALTTIQSAALNGQWQAAGWFLERSFPEQWGRKERISHEGPNGGPVEVRTVSVDELEAKIAAAAAEAAKAREAEEGK